MITLKPSAAEAFFASCSATAGVRCAEQMTDLQSGYRNDFKTVNTLFHYLEITVGSHDNENLFHLLFPYKQIEGTGIPVPYNRSFIVHRCPRECTNAREQKLFSCSLVQNTLPVMSTPLLKTNGDDTYLF